MLDLLKPFLGCRPSQSASLPETLSTCFAVSLCNAPAGTAHLVRLDIEGEVHPIRLCDPDIKGVTGIACDAECLTVALQMRRHGGLAQLDSKGVLQRKHRIDGLSDAHGLVRRGSELFAVATGVDTVLRIDGLNRVTERLCPFAAGGVNRHHVNDICVHEGELIVSMFGPHRSNGLRIGAVARLSPFTVLFDGLNDPHSVTSDQEGLHVLDSPTGTLYRFGPGGLTRVTSVMGFARGLCLTPHHILIGVSAMRRSSRTGATRHPLRHAPDAHCANAFTRCGVYIIDRAKLTSRFIDLSAFAKEVYQIVPWPEVA